MHTETRSPETLGPYTLIREVGHGGNSVVHQAVDRRTGKTVALKVHTIPPSLSSGERRELLVRFAREARAMARLTHPGIVSIHEVGEQDGHHFLAMEHLDGQTLRDRLSLGPLTAAQALPIVRQVAEAVDAVHAAGVIHRDIKPGNVMLLPDGTAKLLDFGVARQSEDTTVTATHSIVGSPTYMSPEQVQGNLGDSASDIWSLGVLLYEMLTGHPPFVGTSIPSVLYKVVHEVPPTVPHAGARTQRVLHRALEKDPSRRYPTACALADALQDAVQAPPQRDWAGLARQWGLWAALLVVGGALGIGLSARNDHPRPPTGAVLPFRASPMRSASPVVTPAPIPPVPIHHGPRHRRLHHHPSRAAVKSVPSHPVPHVLRQVPPALAAVRRLARPQDRAVLRNHKHRATRKRPSALGNAQSAFRPALRRSPPVPRPAPSPVVAREPVPPSGTMAPVDAHPVQPRAKHRGSDADSRKLHDLERFIWSEGR